MFPSIPPGPRLVTLVLVLGTGLISCRTQRAPETITVRINGVDFSVEVARKTEDQQRGLMYRRRLPPDAGMLFVYDGDRRLSFWMKNTYIPLSIAFISSDGVIRDIYDMEPESLRAVSSSRSVRYALELNRGAFDRVGARPGTKVLFPDGFH